MKRSFFAVVTLAFASVCASQSPPRERHSEGHRPTSAETAARIEREAALLERGHDAEARGDLRTAELVYRQIAGEDPDDPFLHLDLAKLYDRMGRDELALTEYRTVVVGRPGAVSSKQTDPRVLSRFGDLSRRYGFVPDARRAYLRATQGRFSAQGPRPSAPDDTLDGLWAAAHIAAALKSSDDRESLAEFTAVAHRLPGYWIAHYYRARELGRFRRLPEAGAAATLADRLAPSEEGRMFVRHLRWTFQIPDAAGNVPSVLSEPPLPGRGVAPKGTGTARGG